MKCRSSAKKKKKKKRRAGNESDTRMFLKEKKRIKNSHILNRIQKKNEENEIERKVRKNSNYKCSEQIKYFFLRLFFRIFFDKVWLVRGDVKCTSKPIMH